MSFSTEVIPPVCWIILYLQYLIVNEGAPELPCMTGLLLSSLLLLLLLLLLSSLLLSSLLLLLFIYLIV